MRANKGFSLVEVLVAVSILGLVGIAVTILQVSSLRSGHNARQLQSAVRLMENFLESARSNPQVLFSTCTGEVSLGGRKGRCEMKPCALVSQGSEVVCDEALSSLTSPLYRVSLELEGRLLETLVRVP